MFYMRKEGEKVRNGFNFYPLSDNSSSGFVFRIGYLAWFFRYSKITNRFNFEKIKTKKTTERLVE